MRGKRVHTPRTFNREASSRPEFRHLGLLGLPSQEDRWKRPLREEWHSFARTPFASVCKLAFSESKNEYRSALSGKLSSPTYTERYKIDTIGSNRSPPDSTGLSGISFLCLRGSFLDRARIHGVCHSFHSHKCQSKRRTYPAAEILYVIFLQFIALRIPPTGRSNCERDRETRFYLRFFVVRRRT